MAVQLTRIYPSRIPRTILVVSIAVFIAAALGWYVAYQPLKSVGVLSLAIAGSVAILVFLGWYGLRWIASATMLAGFAFLPLNAVRLNPSVAVSDVLFLAAALLIMLVAMLTATPLAVPSSLRPLFVGSGLVVASSFVASIFAFNPGASFNAWVRMALAILVFPLIIAVWAPSTSMLRAASTLFIASSSWSVVYGLTLERDNPFSDRIYGLSLHPNALGLISLLAFGPSMLLALASSGRTRPFYTATSGILLWGILVGSGSRAALLGLGMSYFAAILLTRSRILVFAGIAASGLAILLSAAGVVNVLELESVGRLLGGADSLLGQSAIRSDVGRLELLRLAWSDFQRRPLVGAGLDRATSAHSVYISLITSCGIVAFVGMLKVFTWVTRIAYRATRTRWQTDTPDWALLVGWIAAYAGLMFANAFQNALWERYVWVGPVMIGLLAEATIQHSSQEDPLTNSIPVDSYTIQGTTT